MTREEYERIKEAEKEHLRKLKQLKQAARHLERQQRLNRALGEIGGAQDLFERHDQLVDDLTHETARHEARLDLALEAARSSDVERDEPRKTQDALDEELTAIKAQQLIRQLKGELDAPLETPRPKASEKPAAASTQERRKPDKPEASPDTPLPDKTIGRMKP